MNVFFQPLRTRRREAHALIFSRPFSKSHIVYQISVFGVLKSGPTWYNWGEGARGNLGNGLKKIQGPFP